MGILYHLQNTIRRSLHACVWTLLLVAVSGQSHAAPQEQLIVFTQADKSPVNQHFMKNTLPAIRALCREMGLELSVETLKKGVPKEVGITPLIVYQNHLGRSVYQGRTTTPDRVRHFIRTSRRIPQGHEDLVLSQTPIWRVGHAAVWAPIKISDLGGTLPGGYTTDHFQTDALKSILSGFSSFSMEEEARMKRSDRGFYMDFYPWRSKDGTLYISLALFSQFHCKKPVFETGDDKIIGPYKKRKALFKKAARIMEEKVNQVINDPFGGDGFEPVPDRIPEISWEALGYPLPPAPAGKTATAGVDISLGHSWQMSTHDDGTPLIQFRFPPPLDQYSGEFTTVTGTLEFPDDLSFKGMKGRVQAHAESITMGESDLDETLKSSLFLDKNQYPASGFTLESAQSPDKALEFGRLSLVNISGTFQLKGKEVPLSLPVEIEAVLDETDTPLILIRGMFTINLRDYEIEGATGPEPQKYMVRIDLNLAMTPASADRM